MAIALRQSTASQEIPLGYLLDSTNGNDEETGLTIANTDIKIWKSGATTLANKNSGGATHISNGIYYAVLDATDTDTVGSLIVFCHPTGALAIRVECQVFEEAVFDALYAASAPGYLQPTTAGRTLGVNASGNVEAVLNVVAVGSGAIIAGSFAASAIDSTALAASAVGEIQSGLATAASIAALNNLSAAQVNAEVDTALADIHLDHLLATDYDPASKPGTATALLNELIGSDAGVSQFTANALELAPSGGGGAADWTADERTALRAILGIPASGTTPEVPSAGALKVIDDFLDTEVAAILADTNELQTDWANGGRLDLLLDGAASAGDPWTTALPGAYGAGTAGKIVGDNINAPIATVDTVVDAIKVKTDYLPSATAGAAGGVFIAGSNAATSVTTALTANITGNLSGSVGSVTGAVGSVGAGGITASSIATGAIDADALAADAIDEILDEVVEGSTTLRQAMRALLSLAAGKSSRAGSTIYLRDIGDTKNRVAITHDSNADRTAVTVDLT